MAAEAEAKIYRKLSKELKRQLQEEWNILPTHIKIKNHHHVRGLFSGLSKFEASKVWDDFMTIFVDIFETDAKLGLIYCLIENADKYLSDAKKVWLKELVYIINEYTQAATYKHRIYVLYFSIPKTGSLYNGDNFFLNSLRKACEAKIISSTGCHPLNF